MSTDAKITIGLYVLGLLLALVSWGFWQTVQRLEDKIDSTHAATLRELDSVRSLLEIAVGKMHEHPQAVAPTPVALADGETLGAAAP